MARLPNPGGDSGTWGDVLNDYLKQSLNPNGSLKTSALDNAGAELVSDKGQPGGYAPLDSSSKVPAANLPAATAPPDADATTKGLVQLAGDLAGTAASPQIAAGAITNADINASAAIAQSKITNLTSDLATKQDMSVKGQANGYAGLDSNGRVPITQLASGIADGTKFIRDDGTLATVPVGSADLTAPRVSWEKTTDFTVNAALPVPVGSVDFTPVADAVILDINLVAAFYEMVGGKGVVQLTVGPAATKPNAARVRYQNPKAGSTTWTLGGINGTSSGPSIRKKITGLTPGTIYTAEITVAVVGYALRTLVPEVIVSIATSKGLADTGVLGGHESGDVLVAARTATKLCIIRSRHGGGKFSDKLLSTYNLPVAAASGAVALTRDGKKAVVCHNQTNQVSIVNIAEDGTCTLQGTYNLAAGYAPQSVVIDPTNTYAWISSVATVGAVRRLTIADGTLGTTTSLVDTNSGAFGMAMTANGARLLVAGVYSKKVYVINAGTGTIEGSFGHTGVIAYTVAAHPTDVTQALVWADKLYRFNPITRTETESLLPNKVRSDGVVQAHNNHVIFLDYMPDGHGYTALSYDAGAQNWDHGWAQGLEINDTAGLTDRTGAWVGITGFAQSPDGTQFIGTGDSVWIFPQGSVVYRYGARGFDGSRFTIDVVGAT